FSDRYSQPGQWQSLELSRVPLLTERQARLLRAKPGQVVDIREAYVDRVVLVVPGGPNETVVEIDTLTAVGVQAEHSPDTGVSGGDLEGPLLQSATGTGDAPRFSPIDIRRRGDALTVAGKPLVPRLMEYHGESFSLIAKLGFNGVWMRDVPSEAMLRAAHKARLWVVCPPPAPERLAKLELTSPWQAVLAWSLGLDRDGLSLDQIASLADDTRRNDPLGRPLVVETSDRRRRYGQLADVIVKQGRSPFSKRAAISALDSDALPLMGSSPWTSISLDWTPSVTRQCQAVMPGASNLGWHEPRDIYLLGLESVADGSRGILFRSGRRLGSSDPEARRMALQLQLLNRELTLLEPWLVTGKQTKNAEVDALHATSWRLGRSQLVMIPAQPVNASPTPAAMNLGGASETASAHLLTPAGLVSLGIGRSTSGLRIATGDLSAGGIVLLTDDPRTVAAWKQRTDRDAEEAAKARRSLAMTELLRIESTQSQLANSPAERRAAQIDHLKKVVRQCDLYLAAKDYPRAAQLARQLRHAIALQEQRLIAQSLSKDEWTSIPTQFSLRTLPTHVALEDSLRSLPRSGNLLNGGDFEGLDQAKAAGWIHANYADSPLETAAQFTSENPRHGKASLRLVAHSAVRHPSDESPASVWITSPFVKARAGSVIEITGWARVTSAEENTTAELLVIDSLGGKQLTLRIPATQDWQPFRMVRTVGDEGQLRLHLALDGPATADVDAVMIREVLRPGAAASAAREASRAQPAVPSR
ncbi:MAG: hypothetical protein ACR2NU_14260, partial [Aeoliella sp.]